MSLHLDIRLDTQTAKDGYIHIFRQDVYNIIINFIYSKLKVQP